MFFTIKHFFDIMSSEIALKKFIALNLNAISDEYPRD